MKKKNTRLTETGVNEEYVELITSMKMRMEGRVTNCD